jgi:hypothetical protein
MTVGEAITNEGLLELLDRERFAAWLAARPRHAIVGRVADGTGCPITRFLLDQTGAPVGTIHICPFDVSVLPTIYGIPNGPQPPEWARCFIREVDRLDSASVSAAQACKILDDCE